MKRATSRPHHPSMGRSLNRLNTVAARTTAVAHTSLRLSVAVATMDAERILFPTARL